MICSAESEGQRTSIWCSRFRALVICCILIFIVSVQQGHSQQLPLWSGIDSTSTVMVKLQDGSEFYGNLIGSDSLHIVLQTRSVGRMEIAIREIREFKVIKDAVDRHGKYWFTNPFASKYLFSPSAIPLEKETGIYQNTYLLLNAVQYGVTDHVSIGGGFELISTILAFSDNDVQPLYFLNAKAGFQLSERFYAGASTFFTSIFGEADLGTFFGMATYGTRESNVTAGAGFGYVDGKLGQSPVITVSGMHRVSRTVALVSENWLFPGSVQDASGVISYGVRFFGEQVSVDLAFVNNTDIVRQFFIGVPFVDFAVRF